MPTTSVSMTFAGCPVYDPRKLYSEYQRIVAQQPDTWPAISTEFWGLANSYRCPRGKAAGYAWLLLRRGDIDSFDINLPQEFKIEANGKKYVTKLLVVRALCMTPGAPGDPDGIYLVYAIDRRFLPWRLSPTDTGLVMGANQRRELAASLEIDGTAPTGEFYTGFLTSSTTLRTWAKTLEDAWTNTSLHITTGTAWPGLPYTPASHPENVNLSHSFCSWVRFHYLLSLICCDTVYDPWTSNSADEGSGIPSWVGCSSTSFVRLGEQQETLIALVKKARSAGTLLFDYECLESDAAKYPGLYWTAYPISHFRQPHEAPLVAGVTGQHLIDTYWQKTTLVSAIDPDISAATYGHETLLEPRKALLNAIGDDLTNPLNETELEVRADELVLNTHNKRKYSEQTFRYVISGHADILPGSQVKAVIWGDVGNGYMTEVLSFSGEPGQVVSRSQQSFRVHDLQSEFGNPNPPETYTYEHNQPPSVRSTFYNQFPETAIVSVATNQQPTADGVYSGTIRYVEPDDSFMLNAGASFPSTSISCWVAILPAPIRGAANSTGNLRQTFHLGRFSVIHDDSGDVRPLYVVDLGTMGVPAYATALWNGSSFTNLTLLNISHSSGTFTLQHQGIYAVGCTGSGATINSVVGNFQLLSASAGGTIVFGSLTSNSNIGIGKLFH
jgi:hypothetical protein